MQMKIKSVVVWPVVDIVENAARCATVKYKSEFFSKIFVFHR